MERGTSANLDIGMAMPRAGAADYAHAVPRRPVTSFPSRVREALLVAALGTTSAWAQSPRVLDLCLPPGKDPEALATLRRWLPRIEVRVRSEAACAPSPGAYRARFLQRQARVAVVVTAPGGGEVERALPWLESVEGPLEQLAARGRLSEFSVLLEGLTTELSLLAPSGGGSSPGSVAAGDAAASGPAPGRPSASRPAPSRGGRSGARAPSSTNSMASEPGAAVGAPGLFLLGSGSSASSSDPVTLPVTPVAPAEAAAPPEVLAQASAPKDAAAAAPAPPRWLVEAGISPRWRTPGVWTAEVAAGLGLGPLRLHLTWAPTARWSFGGRPLAFDSLSGALAFQPTLWARGGWALEGALGVVVERLELRRLDVEGAGRHDFWDLGARAGLRLSRFFGPVSLGLRADATWSPTAREVQVPQGPAVTFNTLNAAASLLVGWRW